MQPSRSRPQKGRRTEPRRDGSGFLLRCRARPGCTNRRFEQPRPDRLRGVTISPAPCLERTSDNQTLSDGPEPDPDDLLRRSYADLRRLAAKFLDAERRDHTLQPTALVHEAWLRLAAQDSSRWRDRAHFLRLAARMMRRILVNHERDRRRLKRGGTTGRRVPLSDELQVGHRDPLDLVPLDQALRRLSGIDPRKVEVVNLRWFAGLELLEVAEVLGISLAQVKRDWTFARAWLFRELKRED